MSLLTIQFLNRLVSVSMLLMLVAAGCLSATKLGGTTAFTYEDHQTEIAAFLEKWNSAIASGDIENIRAAYVNDGRFHWFEDGHLRYDSVDEILDQLKLFPNGTKINTKLSDVRVTLASKNIAHCSAAFETKISMSSGAIEFSGVFTMLLEKHKDGWKFISGHTSTVPRGR